MSSSSSIYSDRLWGFRVSKNSSLFIRGFLITSKLDLTFVYSFMPTNVDFKALLGIDLINYKCLAPRLKTLIFDLESGMLVQCPCNNGCEEMTLISISAQAAKSIFCLMTPELLSSTAYQGSTKASGIKMLIGT